MHRRFFLKQTATALAASTVPVILTVPFNAQPEPNPLTHPNPTLGLTPLHWQTLAATLEHLLPSEPSAPGAKEIHALPYFHFVLNQPSLAPAEYDFLINGVKQLTDFSTTENKQAFSTLNTHDKEKTLRKYEATDDGYYWLRSVLQYALEALLGDPAYGGNPNGAAWQWLEITPGFPRPKNNAAVQSAEVRFYGL